MKPLKKIVLAYSGGLDTTVAIPWLEEKTGADVVALGINVGQKDDFEAHVEKALKAGAEKASFLDVVDAYAYGFILPSIKANALYEGVYPLLSALSRPLIVEKLVAHALAEGADAVAHGCTGKGNDQVRFEMSLAALAPDLTVLAPARHWGFTRDDSLAYAQSKGLGFLDASVAPYSIDENLWGRAIECGVLEDAWVSPPEDAFTLTADPLTAPDIPETVAIDFSEGAPVGLNGEMMPLTDLITALNELAGKHGVGRIDHIESRTVGIKSREVYECPAAMALITAHKALEAMVLTKETLAFKAGVDAKWAALAYEGQWHSPLMTALDAFVASTQASVTGTVKLKLFKGGMIVVGRKSPLSLYDEGLATYGEGDPFDHAAADGFIALQSLELKTLAKVHKGLTVPSEAHSHECDHVAAPVA